MIIIKGLYMREINKSISLTISSGINFLDAPNGSGKSIFLDYLSEIRMSKIGSIDYSGQSFIYLRQNLNVHPRLKVKDYLNFILGISGTSYDDFYKFICLYNMSHFIEMNEKKTIGSLSGGERKLVYLLSILSIDRDWYFLDEPFNSLDEEKYKILLDIIKRMKFNGKNFLITSHLPEYEFYDTKISFVQSLITSS